MRVTRPDVPVSELPPIEITLRYPGMPQLGNCPRPPSGSDTSRGRSAAVSFDFLETYDEALTTAFPGSSNHPLGGHGSFAREESQYGFVLQAVRDRRRAGRGPSVHQIATALSADQQDTHATMTGAAKRPDQGGSKR